MLAEKLEKISYSNISTFLDCPHKWKLNYIDKLQIRKDSIDTIYGTAMHETIQLFLKYYYANTLKEIEDNKKAFIDKYCSLLILRLIYNKEEKEKEDPTLSIEMPLLELYLGFGIDLLSLFIPHINKYFPKKNTELYGIELLLKHPLPWVNIPFIGYIDIVLHNTKDDTYKIIDLKTSRMGWKDRLKKDDAKKLQLLLYKYFFSQSKGIDLDKITVLFLILKKMVFQGEYKISRLQRFEPANAKITMNKALKWTLTTIKLMEELAASGDLGIMVVTKYCDWCPYSKRTDLCSRNKKLKK